MSGLLRSLLVVALAVAPAAARGHVVVTDTSVEILDDIHWIGTTTMPMVSSWKTLDAVARTMQGNPTLKIEVVAFGSDLQRATPIMQVGLGQQRAQVIVNELVKRGVDRVRLSATGEARPRHGLDPIPLFVI
ncbi:MAG TPA: hypothetical protein VGC41_22740, partial [Kofleriaceae bacterium]